MPTLLTAAIDLKSAHESDAQGMIAQSPKQNGPVTHDNIKVQVALLGGNVHDIDTRLSAKVCDLKDAIFTIVGHSPGQQKLVLGEAVLADGGAILQNIGVAHNSLLTLFITCDPIGQNSLAAPNGKKIVVEPFSYPTWKELAERLNEYEWMSLQAALKADAGTWASGVPDESDLGSNFDPEGFYCGPHFGPEGLSLHWTTRSDGCRYEYWSSAPGDNEYGILVRIDANTMTAIGSGSDDGIELFKDIEDDVRNSDIIKQKK